MDYGIVDFPPTTQISSTVRWSELNRILGRFSQLKGVEITYFRDRAEDGFEKLLEERLPLVVERDLLYFSVWD